MLGVIDHFGLAESMYLDLTTVKNPRPLGGGSSLLCVVDHFGLTQNMYLDLTGIGKLGFDLFGDVSC